MPTGQLGVECVKLIRNLHSVLHAFVLNPLRNKMFFS